MRVLFLVEPIRWSASTRFRVEYFLPYLRAAGVQSAVMPAAGGAGIKRLVHRARLLGEAIASDVIVLQRHLYAQRTFNWLERIGRPIVFDFDDALFSHPTGQTDRPHQAWL